MQELTKRALSGVFFGPCVVALFYLLPPVFFFLLVALVAILATLEFADMSRTTEKYPITVLSVFAVLPLYWGQLPGYVLWILLSPAAFVAYRILRPPRGDAPPMNALGRDIVVMLLSQTFILLPLFTLYRLKELNALFPVIVLLTVWATDTCAYFVGRRLGKRKLAPTISPKKTVEGLAGAVLGGAILMAIFGGYMGMKPLESLVIGGAVGLLGQLGDIFESVGKRVFAVKDSSALIPGHGGILDRIDSFLFTTPFVYHYLAGFGG